jgi:hypothetical protein
VRPRRRPAAVPPPQRDAELPRLATGVVLAAAGSDRNLRAGANIGLM